MAIQDRGVLGVGVVLVHLLLPIGCSSSDSGGEDGASGAGGDGEEGGFGGESGSGGSGRLGSAGAQVSPEEQAEKGLCTITMQCPTSPNHDTKTLCGFTLSDSTGASVYADSAAVKIRGRSSSGFPKKNYSIELRTSEDVDNPTNLLGMGKEADWILDGAWADRSFMRNRLTYSLFRDASPENWAPQARYCELSLNDEDLGIYVLLERIKRDDDRVELPDDDGTGSTFILKQDDEGSLFLSIGSGSAWKLVYPKDSVATPTQREAAQHWLDTLGEALSGDRPAELMNLVDQNRIVDWILVEELAKNIDAFNLSLHFVRNAGGPVWVVPWDTDLAYGQPTLADSENDRPTGWVHTRTSLIQRLSAVPSIHSALGKRYRQLRGQLWTNAALTKKVQDYSAILRDDAIASNFAKWPIEDVDFRPFYDPYSFYDVTTYAEEVTHFRRFIAERLAWLDENIESYPVGE